MSTLNVEEILSKMTLEQKAGLCSGADFWHTKAYEEIGLPDIMVSDGPHGLRKQEAEVDHMGVAESVKAICFPTASAMACSFDRDLLHEVGDALGEECIAEQISVLLGPGINMKRSPLCGRNFEYYSEDPYLAGELGASFINGVQSRGIGTSLKHFAANNQEWRRMSISAVVSERVLREIYLEAFRKVVEKAKPWTIMCSYNRINGVYSAENKWLLTDVLRDEWGYEGLVMTDWGAMNRRVPALKAGLDLEMPSSHGETDKQIVAAVKDGSLSEEILDTSVRRVLNLVANAIEGKPKEKTSYDKEKHHALARKTAEESAVLLKNDGTLPLKAGTKLALIGAFAETPRIQGGGSSHINCSRVDSALESFREYDEYSVTYAKGYVTEEDQIDTSLETEAVNAAKNADVAVIFAGLPDAFEGEGYDRTHMNMPDCQNHLIEEIKKVQKNIVIVLHNGSPITMPWFNQVNAVLEMYLAGQASGSAAVRLLTGKVNPSGKLAETFPLRIEDTPAFLNFPGDHNSPVNRNEVSYSEGIFIGYRYYDKRKLEVQFPFGYGLSYTTFSYDNLKVSCQKDNGSDPKTYQSGSGDVLSVSVDITNTGDVSGKETVQLYVKNFIGLENRPEKELREFAKIALAPGETKTITFKLTDSAFSYYNEAAGKWFIESGEYSILVGSSSRDIRLSEKLAVQSNDRLPFTAGDTTSCSDVKLFSKKPELLDAFLQKSGFLPSPEMNGEEISDADQGLAMAMFADTPLHSIISFSGENLTCADIENIIKELNEAEQN